jgi:hypothetical protein
MQKVEKSWSPQEVEERTQNAIQHLSQFIPDFSSAKVSPKPLFGAQQIPGDDPTLRVAEVSFPLKRYARCEIVKVSSVIDMIKTIIKDLSDLGYAINSDQQKIYTYQNSLKETDIKQMAESICKERDYPVSLGERNISEAI